MKKVCFILTSLDSGGTERYLLRFLNYSHSSIKATVICKSANLGSLEKDFRDTNAVIIPFKLDYFNILLWFKWYRLFKVNKFDTIVDLTGNFGGIPMMIAYRAKVEKRVVFYRYSSNQFVETRFRLVYNNFVKSLVNRYATSILSNSKTALDFFFPNKRKEDKRFKVIPNGVNPEHFSIQIAKEAIRQSFGINKDTFLVGHIGRFDSSKNHPTIFKVAKELVRKDKSIAFLFCGMGTDGEVFKNEVKKYGLEKNVYPLGERTDIPTIFKILDVFYFPSVTEGQPNALIEAMISELPIVTSNIDPIKEIIPAEKHSLLLDAMNVEAAVKTIEKIKNSEEVKKEYQLKDWAIKNFNFETNFKKFEIEL